VKRLGIPKKVGEIIEELSDYQLFKKASTPNT
jgi:hypothetical protein